MSEKEEIISLVNTYYIVKIWTAIAPVRNIKIRDYMQSKKISLAHLNDRNNLFKHKLPEATKKMIRSIEAAPKIHGR